MAKQDMAPRLFAILAATILLSGPALADWPGTSGAPATLADLAAAEDRVMAVWETLPFGTRRAMLVSEEAQLFGGYTKRDSDVYPQGGTVLIYAEPVGYGFKAFEGGLYRSGFTVDLEVLDHLGLVVGGQKDFAKFTFTSHVRNREVFLSLKIHLDRIPAGDWGLRIVMHDANSTQTTRFDLPIKVEAAAK